MSDHNEFKFSNTVLVAPLLAVLLIWFVYWMELRFHTNLNHFGIYPRKIAGLQGIVFSPFIHGSLEHLYNNTIPLALLMAALFYFYREVALKVLLLGVLFSGLITWGIGRPSYHIGASGVIYLLASFIFFKGIFARHFRLVAVSLVVVFIYGSLLWYIFPMKDGISWEGHLGGFLTGLALAYLMKSEIPIRKKFAWEHDDYNEADDAFLKHFDEDGNFIETSEAPTSTDSEPVAFKYEYKKDTSNEDEGTP